MRVITGTARGRRLKTLEGNDVRPTTDRVKEAVFSIIQFEVQAAKVLDLFAGSGQMGVEALSRGAKLAVFVDQSKQSLEVVRENLKTTGLTAGSRVVAMDYKSFLLGCKDRFDIAFLDPPYHQGLLQEALPLVAACMEPGGVILCEHQKGEELPETVVDFKLQKQYNYGKITVTAYRAASDER
jgi:16S rRNA (guanine966-N2)-methyltransferase